MALYNITTKAEFKEKVLNNDKVVLVDFWAQWCPPCRAIAPVLAQIAEKMDTQVDVVKVDIEASPDTKVLAEEYRVQGIPNMNVFRAGKVVDTIVGMVAAPHLEDMLKSYVN